MSGQRNAISLKHSKRSSEGKKRFGDRGIEIKPE
jgi:hypothetical protein